MKKILLSAVCLVAVAAAGFGGSTYYENQQMDPLLKANLAALASIEDIGQGEGSTKPCKETMGYNCLGGRRLSVKCSNLNSAGPNCSGRGYQCCI